MYVWLKSQKKGLLGKAIEWNFAKFLIDKNGQVVKRYSSKTAPQEIRQDLEILLKD